MIVLTELSEIGMYQKFNLFGANISDIIQVSNFPYFLTGQLFVLISCEPNGLVKLSLVDSTEKKPKKLLEFTNNNDSKLIIFKYQVRFNIVNKCTIEFICESSLAKETKKYDIKIGNAPIKKIKKFYPESSIIETTIKDVLLNIINSASSEILIHDTYFDIEQLIELFSELSNEVKVKIITGPNFVNSFCSRNDSIKIKSSLKVHDRFICLDGDQLYIFGYSFKEIVGNPRKISFFTRIYNKEDIEGFKRIFNNIWDNT